MSLMRIASIVGASVLVAAWIVAATTTRRVDSVQLPVRLVPAVTPSPAVIDLADEVARLRQRLGNAPVPRESVRNPFELTAAQLRVSTAAVDTRPDATPEPLIASAPDVTLVGVAENQTAAGPERTAIMSAMGEVVLVEAGDTVGGRFTVAVVSPDGVVLRDGETGVERQLRLP